ncbi:L,D-transpeptidase family protein [Pelotomaculum terephthalicicum JT]|uniref:L,D-transpeptidase family protein n=1 Tax=Pelotomaculum TaxID=191373 RepID=UPI0009D26CAF|nr:MULTISPECIES: L,D-transpeptidase family protein [Pelotomaculum]MCG9969024.1 L,D-transpeptidase family protein [Pelotomaculum terephthalicicum JT]OPX91372.1 MAG: putative L,D-transpeptidase YkuD [Pelotomaculum sp. PtaB.Bin117]OPY60593.1 MAG: putative L,D-transpeptidase YkuD [Pelotomaculum sp. PtaU1.Bin065]
MKSSTKSYGSHISINLATRRLTYYERERLIKIYPVGVGKPSTPTPTGNYMVVVKIMHPGGMLGSRWMGLSVQHGNYGIHGTNNPSSIGGYVSNGCIRMYNQDVEELFPKVQIGTPVNISSGANEPGPNNVHNNAQNPTTNHTVQAGETLWEIAERYGKTLNQILAANQINNPDVIYPGQQIIIPG